jgi:hypothetical protein
MLTFEDKTPIRMYMYRFFVNLVVTLAVEQVHLARVDPAAGRGGRVLTKVATLAGCATQIVSYVQVESHARLEMFKSNFKKRVEISSIYMLFVEVVIAVVVFDGHGGRVARQVGHGAVQLHATGGHLHSGGVESGRDRRRAAAAVLVRMRLVVSQRVDVTLVGQAVTSLHSKVIILINHVSSNVFV